MNIIERKIAQLEYKYQSRLLNGYETFLINFEYLYGDDDTATCLVESDDFEKNTVAIFDKHTNSISFNKISDEDIKRYRKIKQKWIDIAEAKGLK